MIASDALSCLFYFFFMDTAATDIYTYWHTLSLHDALPISGVETASRTWRPGPRCGGMREDGAGKAVLAAAALQHAGFELGRFRHHVAAPRRVEDQLDVGLGHGRDHFQLAAHVVDQDLAHPTAWRGERHLHFHQDRKSTRLNSSH